jgi:hypothetical protein
MRMNVKKALVALIGLGIGVAAIAETDYVVQQGVEKVVTRKLLVQGRNASATINGDVTVTGAINSGGNLLVGGDLAISGDLSADDISAGTINGDAVLYGQQGQNVTNGQVVVLVAGAINTLTAINGTNGATDTITLAEFDADDVGKVTYIINHKDATNFVGIAKSGFFYGDAIVLGGGDSMALLPVSTNVIYGK